MAFAKLCFSEEDTDEPLNRANDRIAELTAALAELVDLHDNVKIINPEDHAELEPLAWEEARRVLKGGGE